MYIYKHFLYNMCQKRWNFRMNVKECGWYLAEGKISTSLRGGSVSGKLGHPAVHVILDGSISPYKRASICLIASSIMGFVTHITASVSAEASDSGVRTYLISPAYFIASIISSGWMYVIVDIYRMVILDGSSDCASTLSTTDAQYDRYPRWPKSDKGFSGEPIWFSCFASS